MLCCTFGSLSSRNAKDQLLKAAYYEVARNGSKIENYLARGIVENTGQTK